MRLDLLKTLNAERAARRAVFLITNEASGEQRLVKAADIAGDPLHDLLDAHRRSGKSGMEETSDGKVFITAYVPPPAPCTSAKPWRRWRRCSTTT